MLETGFLYQVAKGCLKEYGEEVKDLCLIFPNRRSSLFFRRYLGRLAGKPMLAPAMYTIDDLFLKMSDSIQVDKIDALWRLFQTYNEVVGDGKFSFDDFVGWGDVMLSDFNDIDKYIVDADALFSNIRDLNELNSGYTFLTEEQREAVYRFWGVVIKDEEESDNKKQFRSTWILMRDLYNGFRERLKGEGLAYGGMAYRHVAEVLKDENHPERESMTAMLSNYKGIVCIGLNALCECEKVLFDVIKKEFNGKFFWDFDGEMLTDPANKAGNFIRDLVKRYPQTIAIDAPVEKNQEYEMVYVASGIGQAKHASTLLESLAKEDGLEDTAVVLPDENLLMPLLNSIPECVDKVNVTMGYALSNSITATFMSMLARLQNEKRAKGGRLLFYHGSVEAILRHPFIRTRDGGVAEKALKQIVKSNLIYVDPAEIDSLKEDPLLSLILTPIEDSDAIALWQLEILESIAPELGSVEKDFALSYYRAVRRIRDLGIAMQPKTYFRFLRQVTSRINVPFRGEPLHGLQVMGPLETRALDFKNVIIFSVNEGVFPKKNSLDTFIPHNLRYGYGLPTMEYLDSISAYHFYRGICRAQRVWLFCDTRTAGVNQSGEPSRYIRQLQMLYGKNIKETIVSYTVSVEQAKGKIIDKSDAVMAKIDDYFANHTISASSLNSYLDCPAKFYYYYILGIKDPDEVKEKVESNDFGSIYHYVMEHLYAPFIGNGSITVTALEEMAKDRSRISDLIDDGMMETLKIKSKPAGKLLITKDIIANLVVRTLELEKKYAPLQILGLELNLSFNRQVELPDGSRRDVKFYGKIDRVDKPDGCSTRICDYKTGSPNAKVINDVEEVESIFDGSKSDRSYLSVQLLFYAMLLKKRRPELYGPDRQVTSIYSTRLMFQNNPVEEITYDDSIEQRFEEHLDSVIREIFDREKPFETRYDSDGCIFCKMDALCGHIRRKKE